MSFGGAVAGMIASLKHNRRSRKSMYDEKSPRGKASIRKKPLRDQPASPELLEQIRETKRIEKRNRIIKIILTFVIFFSVLYGFVKLKN